MLRFALLISGCLAFVAWIVWITERRAIAFAAATLVAGASIAFLGGQFVDCRACNTSTLSVGMVVSVPFFVVGWIALSASGAGGRSVAWFRPTVIGVGTFQLLWTIPLLYVSTYHGECPCSGLLFKNEEPNLFAIGIDRWVGVVLATEAIVTLWLLAHRS